jgi:hypothetical protein
MLRNSCLGKLAHRIVKKIFCDHNYTLLYYKDTVILDPENHGSIEMNNAKIAMKLVKELRCHQCKKTVALMIGTRFQTVS